ncbi:MAG: glycine oxidase ThiO [Candidatus Woesearchaeota archaeon]|jgi:thiazole synthase/glycine oxidase|nr:glycine oxidase ThiO [Candidatus Woesearchaeota archaeon]|tara:strand:+ start:2455 stop:3576 length:1122 start_codon:yes stop_codon:yes gene_type:complete
MKKAIIIGAGIIGLSISYYLKKNNFDIIVLEKSKAGEEASYASAGMLAAQSEFDFYEKFMDFCIKSRDMYADFCKDIENASGINVELQKCGMIRPALNEGHELHFKQNYKWQKKHGFEIEFLNGRELRKIESKLSENIVSGLYTKNDGQVNNRKLMEALIISNKKNNVKIIENCEVKDYLIKNNKINGVKTNNGTLNADIVVNAAGSWSSLISQELIPNFKVKPIRGQIVSLQANKEILKKVIFASVLGKGGYIVPRKDNTIILGSTVEDIGFEKRNTEEGINSILKNCFNIIPKLKDLKIIEKWSGFRPLAEDQLPIIGKTNIENLILATAHHRNGILLAPITAKAITELIVNGNILPEIKDFNIDRFNNKN